MISFGSTDKNNMTERLVKLLRGKLFKDFNFLVVVGMHNVRKYFIETECQDLKNFKYIFSPKNIEKYMLSSDICIGSLGISLYERFFIGLPSMIIGTSAIQERLHKKLFDKKLIISIGSAKEFCGINFKKTILKNLQNLNKIKELKNKILTTYVYDNSINVLSARYQH